jgi:hypothetical protein
MKKFNKALIIFIIIFTPILSQVLKSSLEMPEGFTKLVILVEEPKNLFTSSEIESFVKLKLRRNGIEYFKSTEDPSFTFEYPVLYINLNIGLSKGDLYYGSVRVNLQRSILFDIDFSDMNKRDFDINKYIELNGRGAIFGAAVEDYSGTFIKSPPANQYLKDYLDDFLDIFISDYIDANNL